MSNKPVFNRMMSGISKDLIITPFLLAQLNKGEYGPFETKMPGRKERKYDSSHVDGWFHPSSHTTLGARKLYYYLTEPQNWDPEPFSAEGRMSVTIGTMMHSFIEKLLLDCGALVAPEGETCTACSKKIGKKRGECYEHGVSDPEVMSRGHMDGRINPAILDAGFEFKSSNPRSLDALKDNDTETFKKKYLTYYGQVQEYMRMTGLKQFIVLFMATAYPWTTKEFLIDFDPEFSKSIEEKYKDVRHHVEIGVPPEPCCAVQSKEARTCPASSCEIKQMTKKMDRV